MTDEGLSTDSAACFMTGDTAGSAARYLPPYFCRLLPETVHFLKPSFKAIQIYWKPASGFDNDMMENSAWFELSGTLMTSRGMWAGGVEGVGWYYSFYALKWWDSAHMILTMVIFCSHSPDYQPLPMEWWIATDYHVMYAGASCFSTDATS